MNKIPNPATREAICDLMQLAMTTPSEQADVFVRWSPHATSLDVDFHRGGWRDGDNKTWNEDLYLGHYAPAEQVQVVRGVIARIEADLRGITPEELERQRVERVVFAVCDSLKAAA